MVKKILLLGYHGFYNVGADARLEVNVKQIKEAISNSKITILSFGKYLKNRFKNFDFIVPKFHFTEAYLEIFFRLKNYDIVILDEGIPFSDRWGDGFLKFWKFCLMLAKKLGKTTILYGIDVDEIDKKTEKLRTKIFDEYCDLIISRTRYSYDKILSFVTKKNKVKLGQESAYLLKPKQTALKLKGKRQNIEDKKLSIGISVKDFFGFPIRFRLISKYDWLYKYPYYFTYSKPDSLNRFNRFVKDMSDMINDIIAEYDAKVTFVMMEYFMDKNINNKIIEKITKKENIEIVSGLDKPPSEIKGLFKGFDIFIGSRLHSLIFALDAGVPMISISSDLRFKEFHEEISHTDFLFSGDDIHLNKKIKEVLPLLIKNNKNYKERFKKLHTILASKAKKNPDILRDYLKNDKLQGSYK